MAFTTINALTMLPVELCNIIDSYDDTYKQIMNDIIEFEIPHAAQHRMQWGGVRAYQIDNHDMSQFYINRGTMIKVDDIYRYATKARHLEQIYEERYPDNGELEDLFAPSYKQFLEDNGITWEPEPNETIFLDI
jgi:hypothetical protein